MMSPVSHSELNSWKTPSCLALVKEQWWTLLWHDIWWKSNGGHCCDMISGERAMVGTVVTWYLVKEQWWALLWHDLWWKSNGGHSCDMISGERAMVDTVVTWYLVKEQWGILLCYLWWKSNGGSHCCDTISGERAMVGTVVTWYLVKEQWWTLLWHDIWWKNNGGHDICWKSNGGHYCDMISGERAMVGTVVTWSLVKVQWWTLLWRDLRFTVIIHETKTLRWLDKVYFSKST